MHFLPVYLYQVSYLINIHQEHLVKNNYINNKTKYNHWTKTYISIKKTIFFYSTLDILLKKTKTKTK